MIRIDDEKADLRVRRQFFPFGNIIVGRDARRPAGFAPACPQSQ